MNTLLESAGVREVALECRSRAGKSSDVGTSLPGVLVDPRRNDNGQKYRKLGVLYLLSLGAPQRSPLP